MSVEVKGTFDDYWLARSKNLRKNVKRHFSKLVRETGTEPRLRIVSSREEMRDAVVAFARLESGGWKGEAGTAVSFEDNTQGEFYVAVLEAFATTKQARVYELRLGDSLLASRLVLSNERMSIILKTAFDASMGQYSPGTLLLFELLRHEFADRPGSVLEFYTNASAEQLTWSTNRRSINHVVVFRRMAVGHAYRALDRIRRAIARGHSQSGMNQKRCDL